MFIYFSVDMALNPLSTLLTQNKLDGENYVDWKRNLDIVLTADTNCWNRLTLRAKNIHAC